MNSAHNLSASHATWPELPVLAEWQETLTAAHLWTQIVGKLRLAHTPWTNHSWHIPLYVTASGLSTSVIHHHDRSFEVEFDFVEHLLRIRTSTGQQMRFALKSMSVAQFYRTLMQALEELQVATAIWPWPVELPDPIEAFDHDEKLRPYDQQAMTLYFRALLSCHRVLTAFRARYIGKVSPVHFFWGAFDLAVTRFSGSTAPPHPGGAPNCADWVMKEAYSHEVSSAGFWPETGLGEAAFYAYAYPEPQGFATYTVRPQTAYYHRGLREFVLPYAAVQQSANPDETLLSFLTSSYEAAAISGKWKRSELEQPPGFPRGVH